MEHTIKITGQGTVMVTIFSERLTRKNAGQLRSTLERLASSGGRNIVLDILRTSYVDVSCIGVLVDSLKLARESGGDILLVGFQPSVRAVFELTRLYRVFDVFDSESQAMDYLDGFRDSVAFANMAAS